MKFLFFLKFLLFSQMCHSAPFVYVCNNIVNGFLWIVDVPTNSIVQTITSPNFSGGPIDICITPNGKMLFVSNVNTASVTPVDLTTNPATVLPNISSTLMSQPRGLAVTVDGKTLYVCNQLNANLVKIDVASRMVVGSITLPGTSFGISMTPNGRFAYISCNGSVSVMDLSNETLINLSIPSGSGVVVAPNGKFAITQNSSQIVKINTADFSVTTQVIPNANSLVGPSITPDSSLAYATNLNPPSNTYAINTSNLSLAAVLPVFTGPRITAVSSDGTKAYIAASSGNIFVPINIATQTTLVPLVGMVPRGTVADPLFLQPSPMTVTGEQRSNNFGFQKELYNQINWTSSNLVGLAAYEVYRNNVLVSTVPASGNLEFTDHNQIPDVSVSYMIVPINSIGAQAIGQSIRLP